MAYFDINLDLTSEDRLIRDSARQFAQEILRPASIEIDKMSAKDAVGPDSPIHAVLKKAFELGYHKTVFPEEIGGLGFTPLQHHLMMEELYCGSAGLAGVLMLAGWIHFKVYMSGDERLIKEFVIPFCESDDSSRLACFASTEPSLGGDLMGQGEPWFTDPIVKGHASGRLDGDEWVINGSKAAWVSVAPIANYAVVNLQVDDSIGLKGQAVCFMPLDLPGISKGQPLEKVGQRDLPQGEIFFDNVRIPKHWMFVPPGEFDSWMPNTLTFGNAAMTIVGLGPARAAFEEALAYTKTRVQGGKPLCEHYMMKARLGRLFGKVETIRATSRAIWNLASRVYPPLPEYSFSMRVTCNDMAREVIDEALQIHGANGLTKEYFVEKLWRDSRPLTIEDGETNTMSRLGGDIMIKTFPRSSANVVA